MQPSNIRLGFIAVAALLILPSVVIAHGKETNIGGDFHNYVASYPRTFARFDDFELQLFDIEQLIEQAGRGSMVLNLRGNSFALDLKEVNLLVNPAPMLRSADGAIEVDPTYVTPTRVFHGSVLGVPDSEAVATFTQIGLDGFVRTPSTWIQFEPLASYISEAPIGLGVVYHMADLNRALPEILDAPDGVSVSEPLTADSLPDGDFGVASAGARVIFLDADSNFYRSQGCWWCKIDNTFSRVANIFSNMYITNFQVENRVVCPDESCDATMGMNNNALSAPNGILNTWGVAVRDERSTMGYTWEMAHLFRRELIDGVYAGAGWIPGRYATTVITDVGEYDGNASDVEAAMLVAHEIGHNFDGRHHLNDTYQDTYSHCHSSWLGYCTSSHTHVRRYWTLMADPFKHEPDYNPSGGEEWYHYERFSNRNLDEIKPCNTYSFSGFDFDPGNKPGC